jgi:hypothetical protein
MQLAMTSVNEQNNEEDLPDLEMGIGIHTGQVVVGNIGSLERMKYGVVGSHVNLTSRIQSCTTGGQILVSEATRREVGPMLKIGKQMEIRAKGFEQPVTISEVVGVGGPHKLSLVQTRETLVTLSEEIPVRYFLAEGSQLTEQMFTGSLMKLSSKRAEVRLESAVPIFSNLEMLLTGGEGERVDGSLQCKVASAVTDSNKRFLVHFTSMSPGVEAFIRSALGQSLESKAGDRALDDLLALAPSARGRNTYGTCSKLGDPIEQVGSSSTKCDVYPARRAAEIRLRDWACRIRTSDSVRELPNWIRLDNLVGGRRNTSRETLRVQAA